MGAGTRPISCSAPWTPPCSLWSTSTTSRRLLLGHITTWRWALCASCNGPFARVFRVSREGLSLSEQSPTHLKPPQALSRSDPSLPIKPPTNPLPPPPVGLQKQREEEEQGSRGRRDRARKKSLRKSRGVFALIASQNGKSLLRLFRKDVLVHQAMNQCLLGEKRLYIVISLWNNAK